MRPVREHDPEWLWRARLWAAEWKAIVLIICGVLYGAIFIAAELQGIFAGTMTAVCATGLFLAIVVGVLWWRA